MGLFSSLQQQDEKKNQPQQGGFFNRLLQAGGEAFKVVTNPVGAASDLVNTAITHPDQTKAVVKGAGNLAVDVARSIPRSAASLLLSSGALPSDKPGEKVLTPSAYDGFAKTLLGSEDIGTASAEGTKTAEAFGAKGDTAKNIGKYGGVPLAIAGIYLNPASLAKSGVVKTLEKASTVEDVTKILAKANVADDIAKQVAPAIAKSKNADEINKILKSAHEATRPAHQAALEAAHNAGDFGQVKQILNSIPNSDPYKKSMESLFRDEAQVRDAAKSVAERASSQGTNVLDLRSSIAKSATEAPVKPGFEGAKDVLTTPPVPKGVGADIAPIERGGANIANRLADSRERLVSGLPGAPGELAQRLLNPENIIKEKNKSTYLINLRPSADVASDFLGSTGANMVYKLAEGADKERQIIDTVIDHTDAIKELVYGTKGVKKVLPGAEKGVAKTKAGQIELSRQITSALNDRANADRIIKDPNTKKLYDEVVQVFDKIAAERQKRGLAVLQDYSPRALLKDAESTGDSLLHQLTSAFNPDVKSGFSKQRKIEENVNINPNLFEVLPSYVASQAKELGYTDAANFVKDNIKNVDPSYLTNSHNYQTGIRYMQNLVQDLISPDKTSKAEQIANKLIGLKYKSDLRFALKSSMQNRTQKWFANSYVSKDAQKLTKALGKDEQALIDSKILGADSAISDELGIAKKTKLGDKLDKIDPFVRSEKSNISYATRVGAMEEVLRSPIYQEAIKGGAKKTEAIAAALEDPATLEKAVRRGNVVSNASQFNGNKALKASAFREGGNVFGIPTSFLKQYRTFQAGMINNLYSGLIQTGKTRELNIIKRGDPREVGLVNFARTARSVDNYLVDLEKAAKNGEVPDLSAKEVSLYRKQLGEHITDLNRQIAKVDPLNRKKVAGNLTKAWAAAFAIQTLFDGSLFSTANFLTGTGSKADQEKGGKAVAKNLRYSSPVNVPTKSQDLLTLTPAIAKDKPGNLIPGVGPAIKRGKEISKLTESLTGKPLVETSTASKSSGGKSGR